MEAFKGQGLIKQICLLLGGSLLLLKARHHHYPFPMLLLKVTKARRIRTCQSGLFILKSWMVATMASVVLFSPSNVTKLSSN